MATTPNNTADVVKTDCLACSEFLAGWVKQHPDEWAELQSSSLLEDPAADPVVSPPAPETGDFSAALRCYRNRVMAIIAWRDLAGIDTLEANLAALSHLAEHCIEAALQHAEKAVTERHGPLLDDVGKPIRLIVIGMGKLGGRELNFSSDVDLIFSRARSGQSDGKRSLDADAWLTRVAQRLVQVLGEVSKHGFVYRVDTRLRPFGDAGVLVASIGALENYYQVHGREWERYAWVKARPVAGDMAGGRLLIKKLRPFVFRRYLDYGTFESIREMKTLIDRQVVRAELQDNIKLGSGGIREIEFIVQAFQLVRGGQEPLLQDTGLLSTLGRLAEMRHLPVREAETLRRAYRFLRRLENRIQMWADQQTHDIPDAPRQRHALVAAMGYADWAVFDEALITVRADVHEAFENVFVSPLAGAPEKSPAEQQLLDLWEGELDAQESAALLAEYGIEDAAAVRAAIFDLRDQGRYRNLQQRGRRWLNRLIPLLFVAAADSGEPDQALVRTLSVLASAIGRSTYVALLVEYPNALATLLRLCAASPWITGQIRQQPTLLDTLLDPAQLYKPAGRDELIESLHTELAALPEQDLERKMDLMRRFAQQQMLRIAAADVSDAMPLMVVSDRLSDLAEVMLEAALDVAWEQMEERYSVPRTANGDRENFCVIGYGKLGGLEMGYGSDLDLVFLYDGASDQMTEGETSLSYHAFFTRLAQRLIHILSIRTPAGRAYEVDLRLRPSGDSGLMASQIAAFEHYQREKAWTWEHQALVRARVVAGSPELGRHFGAIRESILAQPRDEHVLAQKVLTMREKMRRSLNRSSGDVLDVRQMPGGLIDIEFMAQFAALRYGHECRELLIFSDTIRILETLESAGIADYNSIKALVSVYRAYRRRIHKRALQEQHATISADELVAPRAAVERLWQQWIVDVAN